MTIEDLRIGLDEAIPRAKEEAADSHKMDANCYGAGYDAGYLKALQTILRTINDEEEGVL